MRYLLITVGSRGDAEPFCSLAKELVQNGQIVDLFLQQDHIQPVSMLSSINDNNNNTKNYNLYRLPFTANDFYKYTNVQINHDNPRVRFVGIVAECIGELVLPCYPLVQNVVQDDTIIIASSLARQLALSFHKPTYLIQLQPLQPTTKFPHYSHTDDSIRVILNNDIEEQNGTTTTTTALGQEYMETYLEPERYQYQFLYNRLTTMYEKYNLGKVPDFEQVKEILLGKNESVRIVNAYSKVLIPNSSHHNSHDDEWHVGPLADTYNNDDYDYDLLIEFLSKHREEEKPICIGFGSMPFQNIKVIIDALQEIDRPTILVGTCFRQIIDDVKTTTTTLIPDNCFIIDNVSYPWLLPKCSMILNHGGAGVVHATLRAGIPNVVFPLMGDQFFWGKLLHTKKLGIIANCTLTDITKEDVINAIEQVTDDIKTNGQKVGEMIQNESLSGVKSFVKKLLNSHCSHATI